MLLVFCSFQVYIRPNDGDGDDNDNDDMAVADLGQTVDAAWANVAAGDFASC